MHPTCLYGYTASLSLSQSHHSLRAASKYHPDIEEQLSLWTHTEHRAALLALHQELQGFLTEVCSGRSRPALAWSCRDMPYSLPKGHRRSQKCRITQRPIVDTCLDLGGLWAKFTLTLAPSQSQDYLVSPQDLHGPDFFHPASTVWVKHQAFSVFSLNNPKHGSTPLQSTSLSGEVFLLPGEEIYSNYTPKAATSLQWEGSRLKNSRNRNHNRHVLPSPCPR